ncbi:hypothetical protein U1Q18_022952, partial [Sarracenia purpurea var. burkii]
GFGSIESVVRLYAGVSSLWRLCSAQGLAVLLYARLVPIELDQLLGNGMCVAMLDYGVRTGLATQIP